MLNFLKIEVERKPECFCCAKTFNSGWRCNACEERFCEPCSTGGKSGLLRKAARGYAALATIGISEVGRAVYKGSKRACPKCKGVDLMRI